MTRNIIDNDWRPKVGDWVEIRSIAEIEATLDAEGDTERLPFMPEMVRFAGQRFQVLASAHKTCDTVNRTGGRRLRRAVHLADLRCDGSVHGGCQAECLLFWKTDWIKRVEGPSPSSGGPPVGALEGVRSRLAINAVTCGSNGTETFRCQATRLFAATDPLPWWNLRQYWEDVRTGNVTPGYAASMLFLACVFNLRRLPFGYRFSVRLYKFAHKLVRGSDDPHLVGRIEKGHPTPDVRLGLNVGDMAEVRSIPEIERTVNADNKNRGMQIDEEMTTFCGRQFKVTNRVERIINERTGEMMNFENPCLVLDGVYCRGEYSEDRLLCPRRITAYWREAWLKPVTTGAGSDSGNPD